MKKEPYEFAHTVFRIIVETHNREEVKDKEQGQKDQSYIVSSIVFTWLAGIEGNIHLDSLMNGSKIEHMKIKPKDSQRFQELAKYDETKSLAYLYKILEELSLQKDAKFETTSKHLDELFDATTLTSFLKFYLNHGNCKLIFVTWLLTLEPLSCFSHDALHAASLIENIFTKKFHTSLKTKEWFKSKYIEIKNQIEELKSSELFTDTSHKNPTEKIELAEKIAKLQQKIITSEWIKIVNQKNAKIVLGKDESGLISLNENDISKGAFEIGNLLCHISNLHTFIDSFATHIL